MYEWLFGIPLILIALGSLVNALQIHRLRQDVSDLEDELS